MEKSTGNPTVNRSKSEQTKNIVFGIILALLVLGIIYLIVRNNRITDEREEVRQEKNEVVSERDAIEETNAELESEIESLNEQVTELTDSTAVLQEQIEIRDSRIAQLNRQFPELREELREEITRREELEKQYEQLEEDKNDLMGKIENLEQELSSLRDDLEAKAMLIEEATYLQAYNICFVNIRDRWLWFKPVIMENASRITRTVISFEINSNILVEPAQKDVYLLMIDPNDEIVNSSEESFTITDTGNTSSYTQHSTIDYDQQSVQLDFTIEHDNSLEEGSYMIEVYIDGKHAGSEEFELE